MEIKYLLSETTAAATSASICEIVKRAEENVFSNVLIIVPEPKSIAIERELLDVSSNGAFANIFVYSFVRLLSRIGGLKEQEVVSKQTCVMILRKIILENFDKFLCYKKTAKTMGFAEKVYETIAQFKASSITTEEAWNVANNANGALKTKMHDLALLYELYEETLAEKMFDDCDKLRKLGELAKTNEFIKNSDIFVIGFDNITNDMVEVLKEFAANAKSITFSCVYFNENRKDKYIQNNELYHKFASVAQRLNYPHNPKVAKTGYSGDFWNIQNYLYSTENKKVSSKGNVKVFELDNKTQELSFVANQILSGVKQGKRFRDFAVIDAELEKDIETISKTFDEFGIPYFISRPYDISNHFFVKFIKNAVEVVASNFSADKVLKMLSSPFLQLENYSEFENYVKEYGVNYASFFSHVSELQVVDEIKRNNINTVVEFLSTFNKKFGVKFKETGTIDKFVKGIESLIEFFDGENKLIRIAGFEKENGLTIEAGVSEAVFEKFKKVNESITRFLGNQSVSASEFLQIYLSGFSEEDVNLVPVSVDAVFIQKNSDGLYKIKDLFIVGAIDGVFPVRMADTGILQDVEIDDISQNVQKKLEPTIKEINKREKFACFELLLVPSENLIVSYSLHGAGATNKPANVVSRLINLFGLKVQKSYEQNKFVSKISAEKQFSKRVGEYLRGEVDSEKELNELYCKLKASFSSHFSEYIDNLSFGQKEFKIASAKEIFFTNNKTSVSQLERYFACPYSFFAKYGLRLKENKNAALTSLDVGTIVHKFAEIFTKKIKEFDNLESDEFDKKVKEILTKSLEILKINTQKNIGILNFVYDEVLRLAKFLKLEQERSSFKNDAKLNEFEFFGNNAVKLQLDANTIISIEGKIDRIDKFGNYVRIIDYKTGATDSSLSSIYFGKKIQLVSYLSAVGKIGKEKIAGLLFFPIYSDFVKIQQKIKNNYKMQGFLLDDIDVIKYMDSGLSIEKNESDFVPVKIKNNKDVRDTGELQISYGRTKTFMTEKEFDAVKNYTESLCKGAVQEILDGNIEPAPIAKISERESSECKFCELAGFCGREKSKFGMGRRCGTGVQIGSFDLNEGEDYGN